MIKKILINRSTIYAWKSIDKKYTFDETLSSPWNYTNRLAVQKVRENLKERTTAKFHTKNIILSIVCFIISIGFFVGTGFIIKYFVTSNGITTFDGFLLILFTPFIIFTLIPLVGGVICFLFSFVKFINIVTSETPEDINFEDINLQIEADYFYMPIERYSKESFRNSLKRIINEALKSGIIFEENEAGKPFYEYLERRALEWEEERKKKEVEFEKKQKEAEKMKKKNPLLYEILYSDFWEYPNEALYTEPIVQPVKPTAPPQTQVVYATKEIHAEKSSPRGGFLGNPAMCLICSRQDTCRKIVCSGMSAKRK